MKINEITLKDYCPHYNRLVANGVDPKIAEIYTHNGCSACEDDDYECIRKQELIEKLNKTMKGS